MFDNKTTTTIKALIHRWISRARQLGDDYHAADIAGVLLGFLVLNGVVARFLPVIVPITLVSTIVLGALSVLLYGANGPFKLSYYAFRATFFVALTMGLVFVATGTEVLALSPNWAGLTIFAVFLGFFLFIVWTGNTFLKAYRKITFFRTRS